MVSHGQIFVSTLNLSLPLGGDVSIRQPCILRSSPTEGVILRGSSFFSLSSFRASKPSFRFLSTKFWQSWGLESAIWSSIFQMFSAIFLSLESWRLRLSSSYLGIIDQLSIDINIKRMERNKLKERLFKKNMVLETLPSSQLQPRTHKIQSSPADKPQLRSTSVVKLPSLTRIGEPVQGETGETSPIRKDHSQPKLSHSAKQISPMKSKRIMRLAESPHDKQKIPTNEAITHFLKSGVLSIPKLILLLRGLQTEEFVYLKTKGIYLYEACAFSDKGPNYLIISGKGVIFEGQFFTGEDWEQEEELFRKVRMIPFWRQHLISKSFQQWRSQLWRHIHSISSNKLSRVGVGIPVIYEQVIRIKRLCLQFQETPILGMLQLRGFSVHEFSLHCNDASENMLLGLERLQASIMESLKVIAAKYLQSYQFMPSEFELYNKLLLNVDVLGLRFDVKNAYINSLGKVYHSAKLCDLSINEAVRDWILSKIREFIDRMTRRMAEFRLNTEQILYMREKYPTETYVTNANSLLNENHSIYNTWINFEVIIQQEQPLVSPPLATVLRLFKDHCRNLIRHSSATKLRFTESPLLRFVTCNIELPSADELKQVLTLQEYVTKHTQVEKVIEQELETLHQQMESLVAGRLALLEPLVRCFSKYDSKNVPPFDYLATYIAIEEIYEDLEVISIFEDGTWVPYGYLTYSTIKAQVESQIRNYKIKVGNIIPSYYSKEILYLRNTLNLHLKEMEAPLLSAEAFVKVLKYLGELEDEVPDYVNRLETLKKYNLLYEREFKYSLEGYSEISNLLATLRNKMLMFQISKDNNLSKYRTEAMESLVQVQLEITKLDNMLFNRNYEQERDPLKTLEAVTDNIQGLTHKVQHLGEMFLYLGIGMKPMDKLPGLQYEFQVLREIWRLKKRWERVFLNLPYMKVSELTVGILDEQRELVKSIDEEIKKKPKIPVSLELREKISNFSKAISIASSLKESPLPREFEDKINKVINTHLGHPNPPRNIFNKGLSLGALMNAEVLQCEESIHNVIFEASKEQEIKEFITQLEIWWHKIKLEVEPYSERLSIFSPNLNLRKEIEDITLGLVGVLNSKFGGSTQAKCSELLHSIEHLNRLLEEIFRHQESMIKIYPAIMSEYCRNQLMGDSKKFQTIISGNILLMKQLAHPTKHLNPMTFALLDTNIKQFEGIQKNIDDFLEKKRIHFQRFYFLEDSELIQLLTGENKNLALERMFEGVKAWHQQGEQIMGVVGNGNEVLRLRNWRYSSTQQIDTTFKNLEESIRYTLRMLIRDCLHDFEVRELPLRDAEKGLPWVCTYTVEWILFCKQIEINFLHDESENSYDLQLELLRGNLTELLASPLENSNLITVTLQQIYVTEQLHKNNVRSLLDYEWQTLLRYYSEDEIVMRCLGSRHQFGGEYQGVWEVMVHTKDIKRVHATLLGGLNWAQGTLVQGPSGTGKTETLKELARCMSKYCLVFNCSLLVSTRLIEKLLSGLCYTGSWICFDEINRLEADVMSIVSTQISLIRTALLGNEKKLLLAGKEIRLREGIAILCTMNPNYSDRKPLTDNLKRHFRYVTMNLPNYQRIIEVMLYSRGFKDSNSLASKIWRVHELLNIYFNEEKHYDFGLRAIKSLFSLIDKGLPLREGEHRLVKRALYQNIKSRVTAKDKEVFLKTLDDTFRVDIEQSLSSPYEEKYEIMKNTPLMGTILLGKTSCKSWLINRYILEHNCISKRYSPGSLPVKYFLGTKESVGVVEHFAKASVEDNAREYVLHVDSTLRSEWIENLNTLLDNTSILTLPNGSRVKLHRNFKVIMETETLDHVSLATVTRCTIIYVQPQLVPIKEFIGHKLAVFNFPKSLGSQLLEILCCLDKDKIQWVFNLFPAFLPPYPCGQEWIYTEAIGVQRVMVYLIGLLGSLDKIKHLLAKDLMPPKLPISNFYLCFDRYPEGEYLSFPVDPPRQMSSGQLHIPNALSSLYKYTTSRLVLSNYLGLYIMGQPGSGKTNNIRNALQHLPPGIKTVTISINSYTSSLNLYGMITQKFEKDTQGGSTYHAMIPIENYEKLVIVVEDINLSNPHCIELMRTFVETHSMTDVKTLDNKTLGNYLLVFEATDIASKRLLNRLFPLEEALSLDCKIELISKIFSSSVQSTNLHKDMKAELSSNILSKLSRVISMYSLQMTPHDFGLTEVRWLSEALTLLTPDNAISVETVIEVLLFSINRVYHEQIVPTAQRDASILAFKKHFSDHYNKRFMAELEKSCKFIFYDTQELLFTTLSHKCYTRVIDVPALASSLQDLLLERDLKHVYLTNQLTRQICKISELAHFPGRNCLVFGSGGVGKNTLVKMAMLLAGRAVIDPPNNLPQEEASKILFEYMCKTLEGPPVALLLKDPSLEWLAAIENKLAHPFESLAVEEKGQAYQNVIHTGQGYEVRSKDFDHQVRDFVWHTLARIMLILVVNEPESLATIRNHRKLSTTLQMNHIAMWSEESLCQISFKVLSSCSKQITNLLDRVVRLSVSAFKKILFLSKQHPVQRELSLTPAQFIRFVQGIVSIEKSRLQALNTESDRLSKSIKKIEQADSSITSIRNEIVMIEPQLQEKETQLKQTILRLKDRKRETTDIRILVNEEKEAVEAKRNQMQALKDDAEEDLQRALPLLNEALISVAQIKRDKLSEIKFTQYPHPMVQFSLENLCLLLGEGIAWDNIKRVLWDTDLLYKLKHCQPKYQDYIAVKKRIEANPDWSLDSLGNISVAAKVLGVWVVNAVSYAEINHLIQVKRTKVIDITKELSVGEATLQMAENELAQANRKVEAIEEQYQVLHSSHVKLDQLIKLNRQRIERAQELQSGLAESKKSWSLKLPEIMTSLRENSGNSFLSAAELELTCCYSMEIREEFLSYLRELISLNGLPFSQDYSLLSVYNPILTIEWEANGLVSDKNSLQNAVSLFYHMQRFPIILDPEDQALQWLTKQFRSSITVTKTSLPGSVKTVEGAIKQGHKLVLLLHQKDGLDPLTSSLLWAKTELKGNRRIMEVLKYIIEVGEGYSLMFLTKSTQSKLVKRLVTKSPLINFTISQQALEEQLKLHLMKLENEPLYQSNVQLQSLDIQYKTEVSRVEESIVEELSNTTSGLLDSDQVMTLIKRSATVHAKLFSLDVVIASKQASLSSLSTYYQRIIQLPALLYMKLKLMSSHNQMVAFSYGLFLSKFSKICSRDSASLGREPVQQECKRPGDRGEQRDSVQRAQTVMVEMLKSFRKGLSSVECLVLGLIICIHNISSEEVAFLLRNFPRRTHLQEYIDAKEVTDEIRFFFEGLPNDKDETLHAILKSPNPFKIQEYPLSPFSMLLLVKLMKPERFRESVEQIINAQGYHSLLTKQAVRNLEDAIQECDSTHPLLVVMGEDPLPSILQILRQRNPERRIVVSPLGEGQNESVLQSLEEVFSETTLIVHNLHFSDKITARMCKLIEEFEINTPHPESRLIIITKPTPLITKSASETCIKLLVEPTSGIKNQVKELITNYFDEVKNQTPECKAVAYSTALLHAILNDRRLYSTKGWNFTHPPYVFPEFEYQNALRTVVEVFNWDNNDNCTHSNVEQIGKYRVSIHTLRYLVGHINYEGRVTDDLDKLKTRALVSHLLPQKLLDSKTHPQIKTMGLKPFGIPPNLQSVDSILRYVEMLPEDSPEVLGLHFSAIPMSNYPSEIISYLQNIFLGVQEETHPPKPDRSAKLAMESIHHQLPMVNHEIETCIDNEGGNALLLSLITPETRVFDLKAFSNPKKFLVSIAQTFAIKNHVDFDDVSLIFTFASKEELYGISNLRLEGGRINNGMLEDASESRVPVVYICPSIRGKEKLIPQCEYVSIPLYRSSVHQGVINSFGENMNWISNLKMPSKKNQEYWILRGCALTLDD